MKNFISMAAVVALIVLIVGCGGGGGGGGSSSGTTSGAIHAQQISSYGSANQMLDTRNLLVGDVVQLNITARDANNNLVILSASGWKTNAPANVATVSSTGVLQAVGVSGVTTYLIEITYNGVPYQANLNVYAPQDLVTGIVRNQSNPIQDAVVDFFDANGTQVGVAFSARDGSFRASVPSTATKFTIDMSLADPGSVNYYPQFAYGNLVYLNGTSCLAPIPTPLSASVPTALPNPVVPYLRNSGPPPPPTGCIG